MKDMIDFSLVSIINSPGIIKSWPITTSLTQLDLTDDGINPHFDKKETWPEVTPPNWSGPMTFTLWLFLKLNNNWWASGIIQFYRGLEKSGGAVYKNKQIANNWVYDNRWLPMTNYQPKENEIVGFMVSAGNARGRDDHIVAERSQIVTLLFPLEATSYLFSDNPGPQPPPNDLVEYFKGRFDKVDTDNAEILRILQPYKKS